MKLKSRLDKLEKAHSIRNGEFKYTEDDWTEDDWKALLLEWSPEAQEKFRLTKWPERKLEDFFL